MSASLEETVALFLVGLIVSTTIIYVVTKLFGEKEQIGTAVMAALYGAIIYALVYYFLAEGLWAALIAGFVWTLALGALYEMGWLKAIITAVFIWIVATIVGEYLPTIGGPF